MPWYNLNYFNTFLEELRKTIKALSRKKPTLRRDVNPEPLAYEAGMLTAQ
jgi:hypothetical protein